MELTATQQLVIDGARRVLAAKHGYETADLAARIGALEWHVGDLLALVGQLAGIVDEGQRVGEIAEPGGDRQSIVRAADNGRAPIPVPSQRLAECKQIRDAFTEAELAELPPHPAEYMDDAVYAEWCAIRDEMAARRDFERDTPRVPRRAVLTVVPGYLTR